MDTRLKNVIIALVDETKQINAGKTDKSTYNRLKNVINAWVEWKSAKPAVGPLYKFNIGDTVKNNDTTLVKDITPTVPVNSFFSLIIKFIATSDGSKLYKVLLFDDNEYVNVVDILEKNLGISTPSPLPSPLPLPLPLPTLPSDHKIIINFIAKLKANITIINSSKSDLIPNSIVFDIKTRQKVIDIFTANKIINYNILQFKTSQKATDTGEIDLYVYSDLSTLSKDDVVGKGSISTLYAFELKGYIDDSLQLTIEDYKAVNKEDWMKGGAKVYLKMQIILEKINGPVIRAEVDVSTLSATSSLPVDSSAVEAAVTSTSGT